MAAALFSQVPPPCLCPSLPPAIVVLLYVLSLSASHNPFAGALSWCLAFFSATIGALASCWLWPATVHRRRLSSPNLPLLPLPPLPGSPSLSSLCLLWFASPANALLLHYITVHPPPSLPALSAAHPLTPLPQTDREGWVKLCVCMKQWLGTDGGGWGCKRRWEGKMSSNNWCKPLLSPSNTHRSLLWAF